MSDLIDIATIDIFAGLDASARSQVLAGLETRRLARGTVLIREGERADQIFVVLSGRFVVTRQDRVEPLNEIGAGQTIGEIAFFAGGVRTATVTALRDSLVLCLAQAEYERLAERLPGLQRTVTAVLARRLADASAGRHAPRDPRPRTIALIGVGGRPVGEAFSKSLREALGRTGKILWLDRAAVTTLLGAQVDFEIATTTERLNALERAYDTLIYVADAEPNGWSLTCIRQADLALLVAHHADDPAPNALEAAVTELLPAAQRRLVLLHPERGEIQGTARWLAHRDVAMHHHVALDQPEDTARLVRFLHGTAVGLVAGGGGAFCVAHVGVYQALMEAGWAFDMLGGTSGGSAMTAAFAMGASPADITAAIAEAFVANKAMRRYTIPRYGLIDHTHYDAQLMTLYGERLIEDLWLPWFSVSTNLSSNHLHLHRTGLLWQAVRASSAIPVLLPPFYTAEGEMLVDGGLIDNVPIEVMHGLKDGPNVVLSLEAPKLVHYHVNYAALPSRGALLKALLNPLRGTSSLPPAPGIGTVLLRALVAHRRDYERHLRADDLHLKPPLPPEMGLLDWHRHRELTKAAHAWALEQLRSLKAPGASLG